MLKEMLKNNIQILDSVNNWEEAVIIASNPLLKDKTINEQYQQAMVNNIKTLGSYMILMPGIAMPHARPEEGAHKNGLSLLILRNDVLFPGDQKAWFILCLAAESPDSHIEIIEAIADLLGNEELLEKIKNSLSSESVLELL
ncbi:PTS system IIA component, L-Asc family [Brevinema andersonii]|uniref:Ascorbate-specific PTS system EIIA component n=1 Tax=Brevinema andersonii TaxID=34097 RepID=A0A1I1F3Y1_BREAD|nr:PTS sugar transporter subunit IIA [Brevinema andersonii]SFB91870.1 PTS system IIA component, L-Asc family [Brevinema andersonii]